METSRISRRGLFGIAAALLALGPRWITDRIGLFREARGAYPVAAFQSQSVDEILLNLFDTRESGEDGSIRISVPPEVENAGVVPFRIEASHSEKVAIIVDGNRFPLACVFEGANYPQGTVIGTLRLERSSSISCYAMKQGLLYRNAVSVRIPHTS